MLTIFITGFAVFLLLTFVAWRRYLWASETPHDETSNKNPHVLTDTFGADHLLNAPHQKGARWLTEIFSRSAKKFPHLTALQIPHTGDSLTFAELDARAEEIADAIAPHLTGPDQVVAVAMSQDNWQIVATHLAILKAGGTLMFLDTTLPDALITHMLNDAQPVVVMTRGQDAFRDLPTLDVLNLPAAHKRSGSPAWLDNPAERLATIFYTSGTTGVPRGVECPHAGYVNLAFSYADYFDLIPGMDATSLTSSLGYDGSISEMYSAWVSGCAVVLLTKEQVRSGPDLVPVLCEAEVTVLFCPPVLLTTLTQEPEVDLPYPICRYIVPAGEAFPNALVEPWTRNRRQIINTYGPTEASTDTSRQSLRPGEPITIGSPFPNVTYVILEIDSLESLPRGEIGELCIGGVHVSRGYRNLPEQTESRFITHPEFGRLYRTGDKCMIDATKRVHFLGRIDAQLKVRGHRVEAQAVEDILQTQFSDIEAAVLDYQHDALVAFVSAPRVLGNELAEVAPAPLEWADSVTAVLAKQLPEPSIPTRIFLVKEFTLKPVSGKIDRKSLPDLSRLLRNGESEKANAASTKLAITAVEDEIEVPTADCVEVLEICRTVFETPLGLDDEFALSGGHSIAIARLAQKLHAAGWSIGVRGLLSDCNTARKVANRPRAVDEPVVTTPVVRTTDDGPSRDEAAAKVLPVRTFTALQILFSIFQYSPGIVAFVLLLETADGGLFFVRASLSEFLVGGLGLYLLVLSLPFAGLLWAMLIKSFIGGDIYGNKITPGVYPKWSRMHLRIWCIQRVESMVLVPLGALYRSAPLRAFVLRQLGANVGNNLQCAQDAIFTGPLDLITIADDVAIQTGAYVTTTRWSGQHVSVGPITLESRCKIGMRAAIANNVTVGSGTWVTPLTPILSDVGSNEVWEGAPARLTGRFTELKRTAKACEYTRPIWVLESINLLMQIVIAFWLSVVPVAISVWFVGTMILPSEISGLEGQLSAGRLFSLVWHLALYAFTTTWVTIVVTSVLGCLFIRFTAASPGLYPSRGLKAALLMYRMHRMNAIQTQWTWTITGQYLRALAGLRFPRVGASECDIMYNVVPEVACADSRVFWSNGCFTNMLDYGAEHIKLRQIDMPENFFTGNNCVAEYGHFPSNFLLGVSTPASEIQFRRQLRTEVGPQITVAGNPPVKFASSTLGGDERERRPGFTLFATRVLLNDVFSIGIIPITTELVFAVLFILLSVFGEYPLAGTLAAIILTELCLILLCVAVKKIFVGNRWGTDNATPFWSLRHFAYFFVQDCFFGWCREPLRFFAGTTVSNSILRWMGCKIGERTIVTEPLQCFDWNAVNFGKDCYIDGFLQFHTFENMALKVKQTTVRDGCTVNAGATLMGGAVIESGSTLLPLSLVLKEVNLSPGAYEGSPAEPVSKSDAIAIQAKPPVPLSATTDAPRIVDNTDWLKTAAIILVLIDHIGFFFIDDGDWWSVFGRMAAPVFFFLIGYAHTRSVPPQWLMLGLILTLLESSNNDWGWVGPNILLSFVLIRLALPYVERFVDRFGWIGYIVVAAVLVALLPVAGKVVDYGAEGWLWALLGFAQRKYADKRAAGNAVGDGITLRKVAPIGVFISLVAAAAYVWQEQAEFDFSETQVVTFIICSSILVLSLCLFARGPSRLQPPASWVSTVQFIGRHTLAIYAIELAAFEIIIKLIPELAP
ncbi:MAG TPA: TraX family protein [Pyrinomonadaceae bacterium]|nr:TraX family protein [Pyrinomonadaceae bacterium]